MLKRLLPLLALAALALAPQSLPSLHELVITLNGRYNSIHTWEADFTQVYTAGLTTQTESGHLYLQKPGKMRWDYTEPVKKTFLVAGDTVWQYTAGDRVPTESQVKNLNDLRSPLRFLLGHLDLDKELDQLSFSGMQPWQPGDRVIEGIPKAPVEDAGWRKVWIEVSPAYEITRLVILSLDGSQNDIRFSNIRVNRGLPHDIFTPPHPPSLSLTPNP